MNLQHANDRYQRSRKYNGHKCVSSATEPPLQCHPDRLVMDIGLPASMIFGKRSPRCQCTAVKPADGRAAALQLMTGRGQLSALPDHVSNPCSGCPTGGRVCLGPRQPCVNVLWPARALQQGREAARWLPSIDHSDSGTDRPAEGLRKHQWIRLVMVALIRCDSLCHNSSEGDLIALVADNCAVAKAKRMGASETMTTSR